MSVVKKNTVLTEASKKATTSQSVKRSADVLEEDEPESWLGVLRLVFVTYGDGELETVTLKSGKKKELFQIKGTYADDEAVMVTVWGEDAAIFAKLFK